MKDLAVRYPIGLRSPHIGQHGCCLHVKEENLEWRGHTLFNLPGWLGIHSGVQLGLVDGLSRLGEKLIGMVDLVCPFAAGEARVSVPFLLEYEQHALCFGYQLLG